MNEYSTYLGIDLGDKWNYCCLLDQEGEVVRAFRVRCRSKELGELFEDIEVSVVAIEACTHSPWISRLAEAAGHKVLVGNPRKLRAIYDTEYKDDARDAEMLARLARFEPRLLYPIQHRVEQAQTDMVMLKARHALVSSRTKLINAVRGLLKSFAIRAEPCSTECFHKRVRALIPENLRGALFPLLETIARLTAGIRAYDKAIE